MPNKIWRLIAGISGDHPRLIRMSRAMCRHKIFVIGGGEEKAVGDRSGRSIEGGRALGGATSRTGQGPLVGGCRVGAGATSSS